MAQKSAELMQQFEAEFDRRLKLQMSSESIDEQQIDTSASGQKGTDSRMGTRKHPIHFGKIGTPNMISN
jgi:hypothetical protein